MFHPCRGGVRGGKDQFTWESVKTDKDRECYLGHSVMAPVGRWQQGKDIHWYNAEDKAKQAKVINEEFLKAKELEEKALMAALGYKIVEKPVVKHEAQQIKIKQEYEEKSKSKKKYDDDIDDDAKLKIKKEKHSPLKGPQIVDFDSNHELDEMLLKLVSKYGFEKVFDALTDDNESKKKHKKKHKKHHKSSKKAKRTRENSDSDTGSDEKRKKKSKHSKSSKKTSSKENSSSQSSSSSTDSD